MIFKKAKEKKRRPKRAMTAEERMAFRAKVNAKVEAEWEAAKEAAKEAAIEAAKADLVEKLVAGLEYDKDYVIRIESPRFTPAEGGEKMEMAVRIGKVDGKPEEKADEKIEPGIDEIAAMIAEAFKD